MKDFGGIEFLDDEGYPTDEILGFISDWENFENPLEIISIVEQIWWMPDWGITRKKPHTKKFPKQRVFSYYMSTGGWSGNESIISALRKNILFWRYWRQHKAGGHYKFEFPEL